MCEAVTAETYKTIPVQLASSYNLWLRKANFPVGREVQPWEEKASLFTQRKCIPLHRDNMQDFLCAIGGKQVLPG